MKASASYAKLFIELILMLMLNRDIIYVVNYSKAVF